MKLAELEKKIGFTFPAKYHEIYDDGAVKWLEMNRKEIEANIVEFAEDPKTFITLLEKAGCEMFAYDRIPEMIEELQNLIKDMEAENGVVMAKKITLIPFGKGAFGDYYCFMNSPKKKDTAVVSFCHDECAPLTVEGADFDEFLYNQMYNAVLNNVRVEDDVFQDFQEYLTEDYRKKLTGKSTMNLQDDYYKLDIKELDIWK